MPPKTQSFQIKRFVNAPPAEVYRAFTHPTLLRDWLSVAAQAQPRKGGRLYLWWRDGVYATGEFTALDPGRKVAFDWHHIREPEPTRIQVTLRPKDAGTQVTLKCAGGAGRKWAHTLPRAQANWANALENLASVLETGVDLRLARLPRMGVLVGDFTPEIAAKLGVPVAAGIRLEGTAEGTGAAAAGLRRDDVIVRLGGKKVTDFDSLGTALEGRQAGEVVPLVIYRGGEKMTVPMQLSHRPLPEIPPTAAALHDVAVQAYQRLNASLAGYFEGVTEAQADFQPAPNEWSLKQLLAHFVACERDLQSWLAELINGGNNAGEAQDSLEFRPNVTVRLDAIAARYRTVAALMDELKNSQAETLATLAALPPEFVARRHLYRRAAQWVMETTFEQHMTEHDEQFRTTLAAARKAA